MKYQVMIYDGAKSYTKPAATLRKARDIARSIVGRLSHGKLGDYAGGDADETALNDSGYRLLAAWFGSRGNGYGPSAGIFRAD